MREEEERSEGGRSREEGRREEAGGRREKEGRVSNLRLAHRKPRFLENGAAAISPD